MGSCLIQINDWLIDCSHNHWQRFAVSEYFLIYSVIIKLLWMTSDWLTCLGGAVLGPRTTVTVTIARTGYANGKFGFRGSLTLTVARSTSETTVPLMLQRTGGQQGSQIVSGIDLLYIYWIICIIKQSANMQTTTMLGGLTIYHLVTNFQ